MADYNVNDLINTAFEKEPEAFSQIFDNLVRGRIADELDARRDEIAQNMFNPEDESVVNAEGEDDEDSVEDDIDLSDEEIEELISEIEQEDDTGEEDAT